MILLFKVLICLILFYLFIFCITTTVVKIVDKYRLFQLNKIKEEKEFRQRPIIKLKEDRQINKKYNKLLGVWEVENE